jgi:hypothetical protein
MSNKRFFRSVLTTEPDLDPPEFVDPRNIARRRDQEQEYTYEQHRHDEEMQEEVNTWRMYDAADQMVNSLLEMEGK